jgi:prepilin-type N-terminal cleavage/methylation domain-containing protein
MRAAIGSHRRDQAARGGFTLIELAIVVTILGILMAIAIPNYLRAADRAKRGSCLANQRNLIQASLLYCSDTGFMEGELRSLALHDAGYATDTMAECPTSREVDFDDYVITIENSGVVSVECVVGGDEHAIQL